VRVCGRILLASVAVLAAPGSATAAPPAENLLPNGDFEHGISDWRPLGSAQLSRSSAAARFGSASLAVTASARGEAGAIASVPRERLKERGLAGGITGILRGRLTGELWVRGGGKAAGKRLRLQLNERGGTRAEEALRGSAVRVVTLGRRWQKVRLRGMFGRTDRVDVNVLAVLEQAAPGDAFQLDALRLTGRPPPGVRTAGEERRWAWWSYALVWSVVAVAGLASLVYFDRTSGKNRSSHPVSTGPRRAFGYPRRRRRR